MTERLYDHGMKAKTIKSVLRSKVNAWIKTIEDENVATLVKNNTIVTGGCIASFLLGEKVNDFDIYFRNKETTLAVAEYYVKRFKPFKKSGIEAGITIEHTEDRVSIRVQSAGIASEGGSEQPYQYFEGGPDEVGAQYAATIIPGAGNIQEKYEEVEKVALETTDNTYRPVFLSTNAITLSDQVQLIIRFFGEPDQIHLNFDYLHATNYWTSWNSELTLKSEALQALLAKELKYVGSLYPVCSMIRLRKFIKRGWTINAGQMLKIAMQISALDLTNIEVLKNQLVGVDSAYFSQVIDRLNEKGTDTVDGAYLIEIIDRIF